jgi:signal transduction histidine kinase
MRSGRRSGSLRQLATPTGQRKGHVLDTIAGTPESVGRRGSILRPVHPVVRLNRIVRLVGCPMAAVVVGSVRFEEPTPIWMWAAILFYALVWPQLAYWLARLSSDQKRAAHWCLMFDCACFGATGPMLSYRAVPTVVMMTGILTAVTGVGGLPLFWAGLTTMATVFVVASSLAGWQAPSESGLITIVLSLAVAFLFQLLLASQAFRQARELIQKRRQIEDQSAQIVAQNEALEQAMRRAEEARQAMQAANLAKSRFLANMSHELRTPLNAIIGYTELILDSTYGEIPERVRGTLVRVERSGRMLLALINEVLDLSKIEAGQLKLHVAGFALPDTINAAITSLESLAGEKGLKLGAQVAPGLPQAVGDERRIMQVLVNLVGNAIKFTDAGEVEVQGRLEGDRFVVTVRDTGPGIAPEYRDRVFHEFQQADTSTTRPKEGAGLGLAISKRIIELHGGSLALLQSDVGRGSTFGFTLPCAGPPAAAAVPSPISEASGS